MRPLVITPKFRRAYRRLVKRNRALEGSIDAVLVQMQTDVFLPVLGTHKLSGTLVGLWASPFKVHKNNIINLRVSVSGWPSHGTP
jgi:mRNA-degrading endonuclease YafQ of YafQ-DinJ toxin-antitoxin module